MSKGLEALKRLTGENRVSFYDENDICNDFEIVEEELKTLDFIKENVDISVQAYQGGYYLLVGGNFRGAKPISKETYNLLAEVLAWKKNTTEVK